MRHGISWPVHSIDGICKAIRHTNFAPGDLFLDARQGKVIRSLSHLEKWRLTGLSASKAEELASAGFDDQLGPLAGNSIPVRMTSAGAEDEAGRIKAYTELMRSRATGGFVLMPPVAALASKSLCATFLIFVGLNAANVLVWGDGLIPGMVHDVSQQQAFEKACKWAGGLSMEDTAHCILLERDMGASRARTVIFFGQDLPIVAGAAAVPMSEAMHLPVGELAVASLAQVQRMVSDVVINTDAIDGWQSGRVSGTAAFQQEQTSAPDETEEAAFKQQFQHHEASIDSMRTRLKEDGSSGMLDWEQRLTYTDLSDFPHSLRKPSDKLQWSDAVVPDPHLQVETDWLKLPNKKQFPERRAPQGWLSAVRAKHTCLSPIRLSKNDPN